MTQAEALLEARRRWGAGGWIMKPTSTYYQVGNLIVGNRQQVLGNGDSWEAAFADADAREAKCSDL